MELIEEARKLLSECETGLQRLLAQAANAGDYDVVIQITSLAKNLARLEANSLGSTRVGADERDVGTPIACAGTVSSALEASLPGLSSARKTEGTRTGRKKKRDAARGEYPKFFRRGDDIIKVGWSKKDKREYQHKSPGKYLSVIAHAIEQAGTNGSVVATQDVFPVRDPETDMEIPAYQAYLCLALLRDGGLVEQKGRQGHRVTSDGSLSSQALLVWECLPKE